MPILLAALFAGLVAVGATLAIERWGGRIGGLIATLPSTIVPASLGISTAGEPAFVAAMDMTSPGMLVNVLFLWTWRVVPPRLPIAGLAPKLAAMAAISLLAWALAAMALLATARGWPGSTLSLALAGAALLVGAGVAACWRVKPAPAGGRRVGLGTLVARGLFAAAAVGVAVTIARTGDGLAAGIATVFPSIFLTTMVSVWLAQGEAVQGGAVGPMMLGSASVCGYAIAARFTFPALGPAFGALSAWLLAVGCVTWPVWWWLRRRR